MALGIATKLTLDLAMAIAIVAAMGCRLTGAAAHELTGIAAAIFFIVHNWINWRWYRAIFKGRYNFRRVVDTLVNLLVLAAMTILVISGPMLSLTVFAFMGLDGSLEIRQVHTSAAYWGLILISVHIGMHWEMIISVLRRTMKISKPNRRRTIILRVATGLIMGCGMYASFERDMWGKLFLGYSFDFWDPQRPAIFFFTDILAIMSIYICLTYYALKCFNRLRNPAARRQKC
jgi:hypothetical protein